MPERNGDRIVVRTTKVRAGVTGHNVRYVVAASTVGIVVLFGAIYLYFFA